jgi:8-oxo-dGTP pyrophosphatase MutT (NUDIX family)
MSKISHKCGVVLIQQRRVLVVKSRKGWIAPGGKVESGEDDMDCIKRELDEELGIGVEEADLSLLGEYQAQAHGKPGLIVNMRVYRAAKWQGELRTQAEIEAMRWVKASEAASMALGSIMKTQVIPLLKQQDSID